MGNPEFRNLAINLIYILTFKKKFIPLLLKFRLLTKPF